MQNATKQHTAPTLSPSAAYTPSGDTPA